MHHLATRLPAFLPHQGWYILKRILESTLHWYYTDAIFENVTSFLSIFDRKKD